MLVTFRCPASAAREAATPGLPPRPHPEGKNAVPLGGNDHFRGGSSTSGPLTTGDRDDGHVTLGRGHSYRFARFASMTRG